MTNVEAFPDPRVFAYEPVIDLTLSENMHDSYNDAHDHYYKYPYGNAVDSNDNSIWKSRRGMYISFQSNIGRVNGKK